jgi:hypothetical protein
MMDRKIEDRNMKRVRSSEHFPVSYIPVSSFLRSSILVHSEMRAYVAFVNALNCGISSKVNVNKLGSLTRESVNRDR